MLLAFYLSGLVVVLATLRVITHTQPVYALLYFIVSLLAISCVFFSLGAYFAGAMEMIVYAGAIVVLFVFVLMIFNTNLACDNQKYTRFCLQTWIGSIIISIMLLIMLIYALTEEWGHGINGDLVAMKNIGIALFGSYMLAVEIASMLLMTGLIIVFHLGHENVVTSIPSIKIRKKGKSY